MFRPTNVKKNTKTKSKHWPPVSRRYNISYETFGSIFDLKKKNRWIDSLFYVVCGWSLLLFWADFLTSYFDLLLKFWINLLAIHMFTKTFFKGQERKTFPENQNPECLKLSPIITNPICYDFCCCFCFTYIFFLSLDVKLTIADTCATNFRIDCFDRQHNWKKHAVNKSVHWVID